METRSSKCASVLQGSDVFVNKILSRNSSVGCSSRFYDFKRLGEIPFKWELEPGRSKEPQNEKCTVAPPPAMHSRDLVAQRLKPPSVGRARVWFWKRMNRKKANKKVVQKGFRANGVNGGVAETINKLGKLEEIDSEQDSSTSKSLARRDSRIRSLAKLIIRWNK